MAYFTAVLAAPAASSPPDWQVVDVDLDDVADLDALADVLGDATDGVGAGAVVVAVLEREDEWFALARPSADGVRLFVSDLEAAGASRFADVFGDVPAPDGARPPEAGDAGDADDTVDPEDSDDPVEAEDGPDARGAAVAGPSWAGDAALLADVGLGAEELVDTSESHDPATALAAVGERVGFVELLEALR